MFARVFGSSSTATKHFLEGQTAQGFLLRLKKGVYILTTDPPSEEEIANRLYRPSYISFEYALAYYSILPEMVYTITSATTKPTREFVVGDKSYRFTTIKTSAYTGYELKMAEGRGFVIAEPEKAMVDYLYAVSLGRRALSERLEVSKLSKQKVMGYAKMFNRDSVIDLVEKIFALIC